jgi:aquaglyceroporin related protein
MPRTHPQEQVCTAFVMGLLVSALCVAFADNTSSCLNPARDLGPLLVTLAAGYGGTVFTERSWWWLWGAWGATLSDSLFGAWCYDFGIFTGEERVR